MILSLVVEGVDDYISLQLGKISWRMLDRLINNIFNSKEDKRDQGTNRREENLVLPNLFR